MFNFANRSSIEFQEDSKSSDGISRFETFNLNSQSIVLKQQHSFSYTSIASVAYSDRSYLNYATM